MTTRAIIGGQMATSGSKVFLSKNEEVAQNIETRLRWFFGEAFLEKSGGTPWFQSILGKASGIERETELKRVILNTNGARQLTSFSLSVSDHLMTVTGSVSTNYGDSASFAVDI